MTGSAERTTSDLKGLQRIFSERLSEHRPAEPFGRRVTALSLLVVVATFAYLDALLGVASGLLLLTMWVLSGPIVAYTVGQVLLLTLLSARGGGEPSQATLLAAQAGLWGLLSTPLLDNRKTGLVATFVLVTGSFGALSLAGGQAGGLGVTVAVISTFIFVGYGIHRYELAALGLTGEIDE